MERRELLHLLASAGALPLLAPLASLAQATGTADDWQAQFEASSAPWKIGFATPPGA